MSFPAFARKTNQPVYEEPFDLGAGGASLTRATQEGILFSNPALLPYGGQFHRWIGLKNNFIAAKESIEFARSVSEQKEAPDPMSVFQDAADHPVHGGLETSLAWINEKFGFTVFQRFEPDFAIKKYGFHPDSEDPSPAAGLPEVRFRSETYAGAVLGLAEKITRWWSLGITVKYLYSWEPDISLSYTDKAKLASYATPDAMREVATPGQGVGYDVGTLLFAQGKTVDYRFAAKVDDVGNTAFSAGQPNFLQTVSVGLGLTFHNDTDALHLAVDYRDILGAYHESLYKRLYMGARLLIRTYVGVAAGLYQGYPTMGLVVDFILFRVGFSAYGREYGTQPNVGVDPRNIYVLSLAFGV